MDFTPLNSNTIKNKHFLLSIERESILKMYTSLMDLKRSTELKLFFKYEVYSPDVQEYYLKCRDLLILALVEQAGTLQEGHSTKGSNQYSKLSNL